MKKVLIFGKPLKKVFGMNRIFIDDVLQYEAKWWVSYIPKWIMRIIWRKYLFNKKGKK